MATEAIGAPDGFIDRRKRSNGIATAVSLVALTGSTLSLWETTFKQPHIDFYVSENIHYTRDPFGSYEVLAVPLTIVNSGARDGAVLSLQLDVKNTTSGKSDTFKSTFTADAAYFGSREDAAAGLKRPKVPFAPLSIAGRHAFTGTVLFYRPRGDKNLIEGAADLEMTLTLVVPPPNNALDKALTKLPNPVTVKASVSNFLPGALYSGDNIPLKVTAGAY